MTNVLAEGHPLKSANFRLGVKGVGKFNRALKSRNSLFRASRLSSDSGLKSNRLVGKGPKISSRFKKRNRLISGFKK